MTNLEKKAAEYRLPMTSTPEQLEENWSKILTFGNKVILAGYFYTFKGNSYFGATYEFTGKDHTCEGSVKLTAVSADRFEDDGHAVAWAMQQ